MSLTQKLGKRGRFEIASAVNHFHYRTTPDPWHLTFVLALEADRILYILLSCQVLFQKPK